MACEDCGLKYDSGAWCDVLIPDPAWEKIMPGRGSGGLLCFNCIAKRCDAHGLRDVPFAVKSGPMRVSAEDPLGYYWCERSEMWRTGRRDQAKAP